MTNAEKLRAAVEKCETSGDADKFISIRLAEARSLLADLERLERIEKAAWDALDWIASDENPAVKERLAAALGETR